MTNEVNADKTGGKSSRVQAILVGSESILWYPSSQLQLVAPTCLATL